MSNATQPAIATDVSELTLDSEGRIALPKPIQELLGVGPGVSLTFVLADGVLMLFPKTADLWTRVAQTAERLARGEKLHDGFDDFDEEALEAELAVYREQIFRETYGDEFVDELERKYGHLIGTALDKKETASADER